MDEPVLLAELGIDGKTLHAWIREGLPHEGRGRTRRYNATDVRAWLVATGKAQNSRLVATIREVASALAVSERRIQALITEGMPGEPGAYDLDEIEQWRSARAARPQRDEDLARARQADADARWKELRTAKLAGRLYEIEPARRLIMRLITEAAAILEQLPDRVAAMLPVTPPRARSWEELRRQVRRECVALVSDVRQTLGDLPNDPALASADAPPATRRRHKTTARAKK